jgi:hypothetical protein
MQAGETHTPASFMRCLIDKTNGRDSTGIRAVEHPDLICTGIYGVQVDATAEDLEHGFLELGGTPVYIMV